MTDPKDCNATPDRVLMVVGRSGLTAVQALRAEQELGLAASDVARASTVYSYEEALDELRHLTGVLGLSLDEARQVAELGLGRANFEAVADGLRSGMAAGSEEMVESLRRLADASTYAGRSVEDLKQAIEARADGPRRSRLDANRGKTERGVGRRRRLARLARQSRKGNR